ncbi:MAG: 16S rRNA (guanine(966)-N(2))-methyltransferase RsmD [Rhodospirillales bacterium]|nr:16S rRNA (guanine(966)-N(2))-methyltransferase RsmD [Rhodospirillales bacterium]
MRIVGGTLKGRALKAPKGHDVRPTSDRVRESIFNILTNGNPARAMASEMDDAQVLDVFAGTGAMGLEALSRGAASVLFLDNSGPSLAVVTDNAAALGVVKQCRTLKLDASRLGQPPRLLSQPASLAFLDPPYGQGLALPALLGLARYGWLAPHAVVVVETESSAPFDPPPGYVALDARKYGAALVTFLKVANG